MLVCVERGGYGGYGGYYILSSAAVSPSFCRVGRRASVGSAPRDQVRGHPVQPASVWTDSAHAPESHRAGNLTRRI